MTTVSFDETFSTSDMEELTGHNGDVYIGASLNHEFSFADELTFDKTTCSPVLRVIPAVSFTGFNTTFIYTEEHIKNTNTAGAIVRLGGVDINSNPVSYNLNYNQTADFILTVEKGYAGRYDSLGIVMYPTCEEGTAYADTAWINVGFMTPCTSVILSSPMDGWLVNMNSPDILNVALTGYNRNDSRLVSIILQSKKNAEPGMMSSPSIRQVW